MSEDRMKKLQALIDELPETERAAVVMFYSQDITLKEVAERLNMSEAKVSRIHHETLERLKESMRGA